MAVRITCIKKDNGHHFNPHEAIESLRWWNESDGDRGICTRLEMVKFLEGKGVAYVKDVYGNKAYLFVRESANGNKFVQTHADGKITNNLLQLPECN
ncbi:MAG: hypothetical protein A3A98_03195 [Candidatus Staskawiczbacteria bacterium RIFCSPLOWO2_01_FULL_40_39]|uniref:DUF3892 domain-containing protein n=1 Tax=Candidatus Staskawiczbacteria bacterium RIFCSPHIGHO2_01_FULL_39_25 TaxID=1802202 RepID=A0A1G2HQ62_9BACT|nr:MAG: hypothetical protein A2730_02475 [Candidatus Staskawiczbacteria bacterium RIFCSPHIGHO2_01_FULL_39_25]OGZ72823.1 MAG: hypothetical protein A3A98_03195 [Candidatus Staskawiczbacteria bacterium RIFCSPLOWO2_01_FULL_40_39]OGZ76798.1 MAG: hypothetical protein A3I87_01970 [Candidatus Staskawiczbacteria bacterium RIFCSPLOWO2_02_FULL_39_8]